MATGTTAIVAGRQNFFNAGFAAMLEREVGFARVIHEYDYSALTSILSPRSPVDFLALDFGLPGASGLKTIGELRDRMPAMRIAVFSERAEARDVLSILAAGAHGFIPKHMTDGAELLRAIRAVQDGIFVPSCLVETQGWQMHEDEDEPGRSDALAGLSERQQQVIKLLTRGHANKVIARELGISLSTVKVHVHAAFRTLGVHSRLAALAALRPAARTSHEVA